MRIIAMSAVILILLTVIFTNFGKPRGRYYDCRLAEISPDFPIEVKEECRRIRLEEYKQNRSNYI
jgi:hypothetical protein